MRAIYSARDYVSQEISKRVKFGHAQIADLGRQGGIQQHISCSEIEVDYGRWSLSMEVDQTVGDVCEDGFLYAQSQSSFSGCRVRSQENPR
jgi:hypothetical protein